MSPGGSGSEPEASPRRSDDPNRSRSPSSDWLTDNDDDHDEDHIAQPQDQSERDLFARLELARQNSRSQNDAQLSEDVFEEEEPIEEDLYEGMPIIKLVTSTESVSNGLSSCYSDEPNLVRPLSRASRSSRLLNISDGSRPGTSMSGPLTPPPDDEDDRKHRMVRSLAKNRPRGPRSPSPLPAPGTPEIRIHDLPPEKDVTVSEDTIIGELARMTETPKGKGKMVSPLPRSKRQPFETARNTSSGSDSTARNSAGSSHVPVYTASVEPLSIRRKTSSGALTNSHRRRVYVAGRGSPMTKPGSRVASLTRRTSSQPKQQQMRTHSSVQSNDEQMLAKQSELAKEVVSNPVLSNQFDELSPCRSKLPAAQFVNCDTIMSSLQLRASLQSLVHHCQARGLPHRYRTTDHCLRSNRYAR